MTDDEQIDGMMEAAEMTVAQQVAEAMGNDGQVYETHDGRSLDDVCREQLIRRVSTASSDGVAEAGGLSPGARRYEFMDRSAIIDCEIAWDIEGREPWTWAEGDDR